MTLQEQIARRFLQEIEDHGGVDEFCEKLTGFPEQYLTDLALAAIEEINGSIAQCSESAA